MSFKLKDIIFSLFTSYDQLSDHTGLLKRFNEMIAGELDDNILIKAHRICELTSYSNSVDTRMLGNLEQLLGLPFITKDNAKRRRIIRYTFDLYKNKSNSFSYDLLFKLLGYGGAETIKLNSNYDYQLKLKTTKRLTIENLREVIRAVLFLEPMYAGIYYIESDKRYDTFIIFVDNNGDLKYETIFDIKLSYLNGDLYIDNNTSYTYSLGNNGDFIKV